MELRSFGYFSADSVFDLWLCLAGDFKITWGLIIYNFEHKGQFLFVIL